MFTEGENEERTDGNIGAGVVRTADPTQPVIASPTSKGGDSMKQGSPAEFIERGSRVGSLQGSSLDRRTQQCCS